MLYVHMRNVCTYVCVSCLYVCNACMHVFNLSNTKRIELTGNARACEFAPTHITFLPACEPTCVHTHILKHPHRSVQTCITSCLVGSYMDLFFADMVTEPYSIIRTYVNTTFHAYANTCIKPAQTGIKNLKTWKLITALVIPAGGAFLRP